MCCNCSMFAVCAETAWRRSKATFERSMTSQLTFMTDEGNMLKKRKIYRKCEMYRITTNT